MTKPRTNTPDVRPGWACLRYGEGWLWVRPATVFAVSEIEPRNTMVKIGPHTHFVNMMGEDVMNELERAEAHAAPALSAGGLIPVPLQGRIS